MRQWAWRISCCAFIFVVSACMQDEAEVSYKGDEFFGRTHEGALDSPNHETFSEHSPRIKPGYAHPAEPAQVQSVGVTDLSPPPVTSTSLPPPPAQPEPAAPAPANHGMAEPRPDAPVAQGSPPPAKSAQFIWPVSGGTIISHFGPKPGGRSNDGINIGVAEGEPIWATAGGKIVYAGSDLKGYGNMVIIRHKGGWMTAYAHARSIAVKKDDMVKQGDIVGYVGTSGGVTAPQLHFAIRNGRTPVDPELYLQRAAG